MLRFALSFRPSEAAATRKFAFKFYIGRRSDFTGFSISAAYGKLIFSSVNPEDIRTENPLGEEETNVPISVVFLHVRSLCP